MKIYPNDRTELNTLLAQAIAYKNCGKDVKAGLVGKQLVALMDELGLTDTTDYDKA